jgi:small-conductance mechanosensitive channel
MQVVAAAETPTATDGTPTAGPAAPAVDWLRELVASISTTEGRLAISAVVVLVTVTLVFFLAPFVINRGGQALGRLAPTGRLTEAARVVDDYIPTTTGRLILRAIQVVTAAVAAIALLFVWGLFDISITVLRLFGLSLPALIKAVTTLALLLAAYIAVDIFEESLAQFSQGADRITEHQEEIIYRLGNLGILAVVVASGLTIWGIDLSGLLVGAGFLGIVVGLAARQTLGSLIAGFLLMFSRPFTIGDWVALGDNEGIVTNITIFNTRLENFDGEAIVIPNDKVSNQAIVNRSERGRLRVQVDVGVDYDTDPERAQDIAIEAIDDVAAVAPTPPPEAIPKAFADSAVIIELRFWIDRPTPQQKWRATAGVVGAVKEAFDREGIKIPFPQRELSGRAETGGFRVHDGSGSQSADSTGDIRGEAGPSAEDYGSD